MVEAQGLIFALKREIKRLNTGNKSIKIVDMCEALSRHQRALVKDRVQKAEQTKRDRYELLPLEIKGELIQVTNSRETTIIPFPKNMYRDLGITIIAVKRDCGKKPIPLTKMETDDLVKSVNSPFWTSSYAWEQVFGDEASDGLHVKNGKDFKVGGMYIDYYRRPSDIHCPSLVSPPDIYVDWNGKTHTQDSGCELDDLADEIVNGAALILTRAIGDPRDYQLQANKNIQTDQQSKL